MQEFLSLFVNVYYLLGSIAITFFAMKFAFEQMKSNAGVLAVVSRVLGFVVMFLVLMLVMPALFEFGVNRSMGHMQTSQISRNVITLTKDTAELLAQQDGNIESVTYSDNTLADAATDLYNETKAQVDNRSATTGTTDQSSAATGDTQSALAKPLVLAPERLTAEPKPLVLQSAADAPAATTQPLMMRSAADGPALQVPFVAPTTQPLMLKSAADGGGPQTYTVQRGDSLAKIAAKFGVTVDALCRANNVRNCNVIHKNQVLAIP